MIKIIFLLLTLCIATASCCNSGAGRCNSQDTPQEQVAQATDLKHYTTREVKGHLVVYTPDHAKVDLVCGKMPVKTDKKVIFCAAAAFTGELLKEFRHSNIAGTHVSDGVLHEGFRCKRNTGAFVWYKDKYEFIFGSPAEHLSNASENGGMGFCQEMIIHKRKRVKTIRKDTNVNAFRALCELDGRLCVIDSKEKMAFGDFSNSLLAIGVTEALYLDMGTGWNYSWWRSKDGRVHEIHKRKIAYTTNWITFYGS